MTLAEWAGETGLRVRPFAPTDAHTGQVTGPETGAMLVSQDATWGLNGRLKYSLHHLSDYVVSSVTGGTIWLIPR